MCLVVSITIQFIFQFFRLGVLASIYLMYGAPLRVKESQVLITRFNYFPDYVWFV